MVFKNRLLKGENALTKEINLTPRELQYIAALSDATELLGVSDAFFGMEDEEILQEAQKLQISLETKGYAEMDFDGGFTLKDEARETVDICANCDVFIVADKNKAEEPQHREQYYIKDGRIIRIIEKGGVYLLTAMSSTDEMLENIIGDIEWMPEDASPLQSIHIKSKVLSDVKSKPDIFDQAGGVSGLIASGCNEPSAKAIAAGLSRKAHYYSVVAIVCEGAQNGVYSAMLIDTDSGIYKLTPVINDGEELVRFDPLTISGAKSVMADVILSVFPRISEGFE